jgi:hypothetical protein
MKTQNEILSLLTSGLALASEKHTREALGDRSAYLGLSDLTLGLLCPRTVAAVNRHGISHHLESTATTSGFTAM